MSHVKRVTLSIVPGESCGLQTPVILMARLLFHGCGDKSRRVPPPHRAGLDQGGRSGEAGRSITFYIVLIMSDVCGGGEESVHSSQPRRYTGRGPDRMSGRETDASIELSVIPPQTQTESAEDLYNLRATRHTIRLLRCSQWH